MKKYILYTLLLALLVSCEDEVLMKLPQDSVPNEDVWADESKATLYLNYAYSLVLPSFGGLSTSRMCDESFDGSATGELNGNQTMIYGYLTSTSDVSNLGISFHFPFSSTTYRSIRVLNIIIKEVEGGTMSTEAKNRIKGQALFLRAWTYWELVKVYGGVPMVMEPQDPANFDSLKVKRDPAEKCIKLICNDLDSAYAKLPSSWESSDRGRVTRASAISMKGRVLLFWASPQFNPNNDATRWETAYTACKEAKTACVTDKYALYSKFSGIFTSESDSKENLFFRVYDESNSSHTYENYIRPRSEAVSGGGYNCPTWELVNAFPTASGTVWTASTAKDSMYFWRDRDPRFYSTIGYNGCTWELSGTKSRKQWVYDNAYTTEESPATGFYCKKMSDATIDATLTTACGTDWIEMRYAEVLLNLAECAAVTGRTDEAFNELYNLRKRAGIPAGADKKYGVAANTVQKLIEVVLVERQIELAFENKRYWDLRRRNMFTTDFGSLKKLNGTSRTGLKITLDTAYVHSLDATITKSDNIFTIFRSRVRDTIATESTYHKYFKHTFVAKDTRSLINYPQPQYNFMFLSQTDLDKNSNLEQTINWGSGTFNPLASSK